MDSSDGTTGYTCSTLGLLNVGSGTERVLLELFLFPSKISKPSSSSAGLLAGSELSKSGVGVDFALEGAVASLWFFCGDKSGLDCAGSYPLRIARIFARKEDSQWFRTSLSNLSTNLESLSLSLLANSKVLSET